MCGIVVVSCNFLHWPDKGLSFLGNNLMSAARWMVSIEGKIFYEPEQLHNFPYALAVFWGSFFVFNLDYQESASMTLEMIQR